MSDYEVQQDWAVKDAVNAPVVGAEFGGEFTAIAAAIRTKTDRNNPELTGIPTTPTPSGLVAQQIVNVAALANRSLNANFASLKSGGLVELFRVKSDTSFSAKTGAATGNNTNDAGYVFNGDNDSGLFNAENGVVSLAVNGVDRVTASTTSLTVRNELIAQSAVKINNGNLTLGGTGRIQGVDTVSAGTDATNKNYVDNTISTTVDKLASINEVGSMVFAFVLSNRQDLRYGSTLPGSELTPGGFDSSGTPLVDGSEAVRLPGIWRCLGYGVRPSNPLAITLFVRIS